MQKKFIITKYPSAEFDQELKKVAPPNNGNPDPILATWRALNAAPLNCKTVVFELDYVDKDYQDEFAAFYSKAFKKYPARAVRLHFFAAVVTVADLQRIDSFQDQYLGFLVLRPTDLQQVGRTMLKPTLTDGDKEFIHCRVSFTAHILGCKLVVDGMPFIQQDSQVGACAQASLWMLARYMSRRFGYREFLPAEINHLAKVKGAMGRAFPAEFGLTVEQMLDALEGMGLPALSYSYLTLDECSNHIDKAYVLVPTLDPKKVKEHCDSVRVAKLADIAYRYIESGLPVILCTSNHALVCIGHTYDHEVAAAAAIQRIPDFIVHNDNAGPYQKMPIIGPAAGSLHFREVEDVIVVVPPEVTLRAEQAEIMSRQAIDNFLKLGTLDAARPTYKDLIQNLRSDFVGVLDQLEFRTFLMPSVEFQKKLRADAAADALNPALAARLVELDYPKFIWITEISSSKLLNHPKRQSRQCLGRVIIDSTAPSRTRGEMVVHFADFLGLMNRQNDEIKPWEYVLQTTPFGHQISR